MVCEQWFCIVLYVDDFCMTIVLYSNFVLTVLVACNCFRCVFCDCVMVVRHILVIYIFGALHGFNAYIIVLVLYQDGHETCFWLRHLDLLIKTEHYLDGTV